MKLFRICNVSACLAVVFCLTGTATAVAEKVLEEIIVTATKREESMQTIPLAITAFTGEALEALGFATSNQIASQVPNLQFQAETGISSPQLHLRGVGNNQFGLNNINSTAIYIDSVYVGQNLVQGFQLFDLERVEVLRGPQGTLFGRNATAGLINFIPRKPDASKESSGRAKITVGNFGRLDYEGAVGLPLGEKAAARIAFNRQKTDGVFDNEVLGDDDGAVDLFAVRGLLSWEPTPNVHLLLNLHYADNSSDTFPTKPGYVPFDPTAPGSPPFVPAAFNCPGLVPPAVPGALFNPCTDPFGLGLSVNDAFHVVQNNVRGREDIETYGVALEVNWEVGKYTITAVTGWDTVDGLRFQDDDGNSANLTSTTFLGDGDWFSQEIRITSKHEGPFNWIAGVYYYSDELDSEFNPVNVDAFGLGWATANTQETDSWAVFAESTFEFSEKWKLTVGGRLTDDERKIMAEGLTFAPLTGVNPISIDDARVTSFGPAGAFIIGYFPPTPLEEDWQEFSGRIALDYTIDNHGLVYISASRGFKGGEFPGALFSADSLTISDPEFLNSYEIGYKADLLDNTLRVNLAAFKMDLTDQQVLILPPGGFAELLTNAASSNIKGVEIELQWQPTDSWFVQFAGAYLDAEFKNFFNPGTGEDFSGNQLPEAPEWSFNGVVRYERPFANGVFSLQADWSWNDDRFFSSDNNPARSQAAYGLVNARTAYTFLNGQVEMAFFVQNIFDEEYLVVSFDTSVFAGSYAFLVGNPRTFGGSISYFWE